MSSIKDRAWEASWASDECAELYDSVAALESGTGSINEVQATIDATCYCSADEYYDVLDYANAVLSSVKERV